MKRINKSLVNPISVGLKFFFCFLCSVFWTYLQDVGPPGWRLETQPLPLCCDVGGSCCSGLKLIHRHRRRAVGPCWRQLLHRMANRTVDWLPLLQHYLDRVPNMLKVQQQQKKVNRILRKQGNGSKQINCGKTVGKEIARRTYKVVGHSGAWYAP